MAAGIFSFPKFLSLRWGEAILLQAAVAVSVILVTFLFTTRS